MGCVQGYYESEKGVNWRRRVISFLLWFAELRRLGLQLRLDLCVSKAFSKGKFEAR